MPATTLIRRAMPADMQAAIAKFHARGKAVQAVKPDAATLPQAVARYAESGATRDDIRAALAGLITECTPPLR